MAANVQGGGRNRKTLSLLTQFIDWIDGESVEESKIPAYSDTGIPLPVTKPDKETYTVDPITEDFLNLMAGIENADLYKMYQDDPSQLLSPEFNAVNAPTKMERGFGNTNPSDTFTKYSTVQDAMDDLRNRYTSLIEQANDNVGGRFSNIYDLPVGHQQILVSIADNAGFNRLMDYEDLENAMRENDSGAISRDMLTNAYLKDDEGKYLLDGNLKKRTNEELQPGLNNRRDAIFNFTNNQSDG